MTRPQIVEDFKALQNSICDALEQCDGKSSFREDAWERPEGGGGLTRIIENGNIFEKGGVNFSAVEGSLSAQAAKQLGIPPADFFATGVSIVIHPNNPHVPIIHMNVRYFELSNGTKWYGGGIDLTPHYINNDDATFFHTQLKQVCDAFDSSCYSDFKNNADNYFYLPHRQETRGVGGIFFDRLNPENYSNSLHDFVLAVGHCFAPTYVQIVNTHKLKPFSAAERKWQLIRRGRYVEFNLAFDRGTKFGLETNGRTESILMSLPNEVHWDYDFKVETESKEAQTLAALQKGINWIV